MFSIEDEKEKERERNLRTSRMSRCFSPWRTIKSASSYASISMCVCVAIFSFFFFSSSFDDIFWLVLRRKCSNVAFYISASMFLRIYICVRPSVISTHWRRERKSVIRWRRRRRRREERRRKKKGEENIWNLLFLSLSMSLALLFDYAFCHFRQKNCYGVSLLIQASFPRTRLDRWWWIV